MKKIFFAVLILLGFANIGYSAVIIDTGGPGESIGTPLFREETQDGIRFYWVAGQIDLDTPCNINSIKTFFDYHKPSYVTMPNFNDFGWPFDDVVTLKIYGNKPFEGAFYNEAPDVDSVYFSQLFGIPDGWQYGWYGVNNVDWFLSAGTYWVAFEMQDPVLFETKLGIGSISSLPAYAAQSNYTDGNYIPTPFSVFALKIEGNAVPEPVNVCLFLFGAILLKLIVKK